ncbi:thiol reductant ABC exporter subunit CydC [Williamsia sterculiae]|uniref:ATP-binding cassette, subfamily C, CydC n=1 Tax=Williamsia sterculiae TaxID=1344003 RepID=A0A1N7GXE8_9NOCA|nr:thiol reductant ABC exporter subunit CydC [Williamsia sterculiae]SIS17216.1 ATP-binding cassette, subfamily C, CydC [Williamsia sterculiae]
MSRGRAPRSQAGAGRLRDPLLRAIGLFGVRTGPVARSLTFGLGGSVSALGLAALSAWLITRAWEMPPVLSLMVAVTTVRALGISRGLLRYLERLATHDLALDSMSTARERVYRALATGSAGYSVTLRRGELLARTGDDIDEVGNGLISGLIPIGVSLVTSVAAVAITGAVSWWAGLVTLVAMLCTGLIAPVLAARGSATATSDGEAAHERAIEAWTTALWHAPELAVARRRETVLAAAVAAEHDVGRARDRGQRRIAVAAGSAPAAVGVSVLAACLIGVGLAGSVSPMMLGVLILLPLSAFESTNPLVEAGVQLQRSRNAARRVFELIDGADIDRAREGPDRESSAPTDGLLLRADHLRWGVGSSPTFGGPNGLSLSLRPGDRVAVVGPSGCGKTTLLLTLAGLLSARGGEVARGADAQAVRFLAEDAHVFATSVRENVLLARGDADDALVRTAIENVGLAPWVAELPDGLDTPLDVGDSSLSGGQRRRLLLARAVVDAARVLLVDEPGEHLDRADSDRVHRRLLDRDGGLVEPDKAVVVVTHRLPADARPDRVIDLGQFAVGESAVGKFDCRTVGVGVASGVHEEGGGLELHDIRTREVTIR